MFTETHVPVSDDPAVSLLLAEAAGPAGSALLVIHGGPDWDHTYLRDPLSDLAGRHHLLLPDLRGCGRSTLGLADEHYTWDAVVADLLALLDTRGVEHADVLGFSAGGLVAQRLALTAPERVRRLVIASSSVVPLPPDAFATWHERTRRRAEGESRLEAGLHGPAFTRAHAAAFARMNVWREESLANYLGRIAAIHFSGDWLRIHAAGKMPSPRVPDAEQRLAVSEIPVLLLHGRYDMTFPVELAEQAAEHVPAARAVILEDAGHMAHIDQPERWLAALAEFLD